MPPAQACVQRLDDLSVRTLAFFSPYLVPFTITAGYATGELRLFKVVAWLWLAVAALDLIVGADTRRPPGEQARALNRSLLWRFAIRLWVPAQAAILACGLFITTWESLTLQEMVFVTVSVGLASGMFSIPVAHELMHGTGRLDKALAEILMTSVTYTHFCIEHVHGHHRNVGTMKDPATARFGESFYVFYPRAVFGGLLSAWNHEAVRLGRLGGRGRAWSPRNRMVRYAANLIALYGAIGFGFGALGVAFFAVQSLIAFSLIEVINYVEHYGLSRRQAAPGHYEQVMPWHSWNSSHLVSNWFLFNLGRHSDHHYQPSRSYQHLRHFNDAPQLPSGYFGMFLLPLIPSLWRRVMDPRVRAWREEHGIPPDTVSTKWRRQSPFPWRR